MGTQGRIKREKSTCEKKTRCFQWQEISLITFISEISLFLFAACDQRSQKANLSIWQNRSFFQEKIITDLFKHWGAT